MCNTVLFNPHLWDEYESQEECGKQYDPTREHCCTDIDVPPQYKRDENYHHQHNTGYVDEGCDRLGVIEDGYLDFAGLEGEDDADQLEEAQVDEDDEVKEKGGGA